MLPTSEILIDYSSFKTSNEDKKALYQQLILPRLIEERMLISLRQGKISKWFSAWGQEAISVGVAIAMKPDEFICTMHRNLGVFTARELNLVQLFAQWQGKPAGFTKGRDRSFHFGTHQHNILGMISHLGSQMGVADGIALGYKLRNANQAVAVFTGDGGASEGDFHEAINLAAVWELPVLIIVENNGWGLSTPSNQQFKCESFADKGIGYGIEAHSINGNNALEVFETVKELSHKIRKTSKPILLECKTFRMRGHEEASGTKYYPEGLIEKWEPYDPVVSFEKHLLGEGIISQQWVDEIKEQLNTLITQSFDEASALPLPHSTEEEEEKDVYAPFQLKHQLPEKIHQEEMRFVDAIQLGVAQAMAKHNNLILMGQDIADYGGVFKITEGLLETYGRERVRNTPITEAAVVGAALGLSITGFKSMMEMQFSDFATEGFNQIVNNLAKSHYRWGQNADVVVRMPCGAGVAAGPFHSQSNEAWFTQVPGLKVAYPAFPEDAKALLLTAFEDPNPIMFFEHKKLYRSVSGPVTQEYYQLPFGKARKCQQGKDLTIVTYGLGVHMALETLAEMPHIQADVIDLRTLIPWDKATVFESVAKTGKVIVLQEANITSGFAAEIAAEIADHCFDYLDAPLKRVGGLDTPVPFNAGLEQLFLPQSRLKNEIINLYHH